MPYTEHFVLEGIRFAAFAFVCGCLLSPRWRPRTCALTAAGVLLGNLALQAGLLLAGQDGTLVLTLLPLTAYLPAVAGGMCCRARALRRPSRSGAPGR